MFRFKLRTLLIMLAILPPIVAIIAPPLVQWFRQKPPPSPATAVNAIASSAPYFASYATRPADPQLTENVTRTLLAGTPQVRMQVDSKTGKLAVWGPPYAHKSVQAIIGEMQREATTVTTRKDGSVLTETGATGPRSSNKAAPMFRLSIRDVLWLTVVVAMGAGWWVDRQRLADRCAKLEESHASTKKLFDALNNATDREITRPPNLQRGEVKPTLIVE